MKEGGDPCSDEISERDAGSEVISVGMWVGQSEGEDAREEGSNDEEGSIDFFLIGEEAAARNAGGVGDGHATILTATFWPGDGQNFWHDLLMRPAHLDLHIRLQLSLLHDLLDGLGYAQGACPPLLFLPSVRGSNPPEQAPSDDTYRHVFVDRWKCALLVDERGFENSVKSIALALFFLARRGDLRQNEGAEIAGSAGRRNAP